MKRITKILAGILGLVVLTIAGMAILQIDFSNDEDLDTFIEKKMEKSDIQGLSFVVIKKGAIGKPHNYGYANREASKKVTDDTIFQIASVSKTVTGVAIMQLVEKGLIELDSSINDYLPFKIVNPHYPEHKITVRMLLQHTSSLIDYDPVLRSTYTIDSGLGDSDITLEEFARAYFLENGKWYDVDKNFSKKAPGEEYDYSNTVFGLLGYMVEYVSGKPFNEYCNENIFDPLGMDNTGWLTIEINLDNMTMHYEGGVTPLRPYSFATYSDGALKTTTTDYAKFLTVIINGGVYGDRRILKKSTVEQMLPEDHKQNLVWENNVLETFFIDTKNRRIQGHSGGDPGIFTLAYFNSENNTGIIFFMNSTPSFDFRIVNVISIIKRINKIAELF